MGSEDFLISCCLRNPPIDQYCCFNSVCYGPNIDGTLSNNCRDVLKNACLNVNSASCSAFEDKYKDDYDLVVSNRCFSGTDAQILDNLNAPACKKLCKEGNLECRNFLQRFCIGKYPDEKQYSNLCGCYYDQSIYQNYYSGLNTISREVIDFIPACSFPACASSDFRVPPADGCRDISVCFQNVQVNNSGVIISLNIDQSVDQCKNLVKVNDTANETVKILRYIMYIIIAIFIIYIIVVFFYLLFRKNKIIQ